ncbi:alpha/beta hydrolase [Rhodococcus kronopolitis]|uniref:Alpha/beta hydrolase n=1 Tax=Rhodococcus kronopolitis TaxID=1460226 RepID=A0ABV9FL65_9NOCA
MRRTALLALVLALCCACGAGPSMRPDVAVVEHHEGTPATSTATADAPEPLPVPAQDLNWRDCTGTTLDTLGLAPGPAGLVLECAQLAAPIDAGGAIPGTFTLGALRARGPQTPADSAPLVLTTGAEGSSTATLAALAAGPIGSLLATRPVVALDRRGIGTSTPIDCLTPALRRAMTDLGQFSTPAAGGDAVDAVMTLGRDATTACTDFLEPQELAFDAAHAADDLEQLRSTWDVDRIGLLTVGTGADVGLAYAAAYPDAVGRLVMDSPGAARTDVVTATEGILAGREAALSAFARSCAALACSLGADPHTAVADLARRAAAGELGPVSSNGLATVLTEFLGSPRGDRQSRTREFADVLAAAGRGETADLERLIDAGVEAAGSGQFVARCSDGTGWPTPSRARELRQDWGERFPVFGSDAALSLLLCASWPTTPPPPLPTGLDVGVLTLAGAADPVVGKAGVTSATGAAAAAGARTSTRAWLGSGHPVTTHSDCGQQAVARYLDTGVLPADGGACPG